MKKKYYDLLGIIIFGYAALATINKLERYGWMFANKKIKINAEILSFKNQEGGGYEWSLITIKYYYNSKEYKPNAFTVEGHLTNDQNHIIAFINKNNPIQVCTKNNLGGFFLMVFFSIFSLIIVFYSVKNNYSFLKRFFIVYRVKLIRKIKVILK